MNKPKFQFGLPDIAKAKDVDYRTVLRHYNAGRFVMNSESPVLTLVSVTAYIFDSKLLQRLAEMINKGEGNE